jgi:SAM-dependent methyltransferase
MISDGAVVWKQLKRSTCLECGHGFHVEALTEQDVIEIYNDDYSIGLRDPSAEVARSVEYDRQLRGFLELQLNGDVNFSKIVEFGCGSGSLLNRLTANLDAQIGVGVEPSAKVAAYAQSIADERVSIQLGYAEQFSDLVQRATLCVSVNVIEHALDPISFLQACARTIDETGKILIVCPDSETVGSELLFYDHVSNFTAKSLSTIAAKAGLTVIANAPLLGPLSGFRIYLLRGGSEQFTTQICDFTSLADEREDYLGTWSKIDGAIGQLLSGQEYAVFGAGEYCDLLHAYSPSVIDEAMFFVTDWPIIGSLFNKPVISTEEFLKSTPIPLIAAVNERNWEVLHKRSELTAILLIHPLELASQEAS